MSDKDIKKSLINRIKGFSISSLNPFGSKPTINSAGYGDNEITLMIKDELDRQFGNKRKINNKNQSYIELLEKINNIYSDLHLDAKKNNLNKTINLVDLFKKDDELYNKFTKESAPFSDYNFFYGLDITSLESKEVFDKSALTLKSSGIATILHYPATAAIAFGSMTMGHIMLGLVVSIVALSIALNTISMLNRKYIKPDSVVFCTKYMPFDNMGAFRSRLYEEYHKLFIYKIYYDTKETNETNKKKSIDKFLNFIIDKDSEEKKNFETKVTKFLYNITNFLKDIKKQTEVDYKDISNIKDIKEFEESLEKEINKLELNSKKKTGENTGENIQTGGVQEERLRSLDEDLDKDYIKLNSGIINYFTHTTNTYVLKTMSYRLNYIVDNNNNILTSGNISIFMLKNEFNHILKTNIKYFKEELGPLGKKMDFFSNNTLINLLNDGSELINSESVKIYIINFIQHYIESFLYLYLISEYNIKALIKGSKNILLDKIFEENLSFTKAAHRYSFYGEGKGLLGFGSMNEIRLLKIKKRDKINYFSILMKYSYLALDHIFKRLKLVIKENVAMKGLISIESTRLNNNSVVAKRINNLSNKNNLPNNVTIYDYNKYCEIAISNYILMGDYEIYKQRLISGTKFINKVKTMKIGTDKNKLRYNTYNCNTGIEIEKDRKEERKIFFQKHIDARTATRINTPNNTPKNQ